MSDASDPEICFLLHGEKSQPGSSFGIFVRFNKNLGYLIIIYNLLLLAKRHGFNPIQKIIHQFSEGAV